MALQLSGRGGASSSVPGLSLWPVPRCLYSSGCDSSVLEGDVFHRLLGQRPLPHPEMNQLRVVYPLIFWTVRKHVLIVALRKPRGVRWASWPLASQSAFPASSLPGSS